MSGDDEDEGEAHPHVSQPLLYQLSNTATVVESTVECKCFQLETAIVFHFPMKRFFTRRAGPPVTAWQERHAEEDFLALVRHNAATKLEMEQWPPAAKKRRVGKPSSDEQYIRALCDRVAALVEPTETLPQAKRPGWWRHIMPLFAGRGPLPDGACRSSGACEVEAGIHEICGSGWWTMHCCATCRDGTIG